jgi:hypothetical protein
LCPEGKEEHGKKCHERLCKPSEMAERTTSTSTF